MSVIYRLAWEATARAHGWQPPYAVRQHARELARVAAGTTRHEGLPRVAAAREMEA